MGKNYYFKESKENINEWAQKKGRVGYKKDSCSSYEGTMYTKRNSVLNRDFNFDIRLPQEGTMIFEAAPGIHVIYSAFMPAVELYCQQIKTPYGSVYVDVSKRDILYHVESCFMENAICEETLDIYEKEVFRVFEAHYENLCNLANGKPLLLKQVTVMDSKIVKKKNTIAEVSSLRDYLYNRGNYNAVCESFDEKNSTLFYCQVMMEDKSFRFSFDVSDEGILVAKASYGECSLVVPEAYQYAVADYLNKKNSKHKYASLCLGGDEGVYCKFCTSLLDGPIGDKTIEFIEFILTKTLRISIETIELLAAGHNYKEDEEDKEMRELVEYIVNSDLGKDLINVLGEEHKPRSPLSELANLSDELLDDSISSYLDSNVMELDMPTFTLDNENDISMSDFVDDMEDDSNLGNKE